MRYCAQGLALRAVAVQRTHFILGDFSVIDAVRAVPCRAVPCKAVLLCLL